MTDYRKDPSAMTVLIEKKGFKLLESYKGSNTPTLVRRIRCGHEWKVRTGNILHRNVKCKICNNIVKVERCKTLAKKQHEEFILDAPEWLVYKADVTALTRRIYAANKHIINPENLPRGNAGVSGAYHVDHKVSVRYSFDNGIPIAECAHVDNLQMLPWLENLQKH